MSETAMFALLAIAWAVAVFFSIIGILVTWGNTQLVQMFPEGWRWWMPWTRLLALGFFAAVVLANPFQGWLS